MIQNDVDLLSGHVHAIPTRSTATATDAAVIIRAAGESPADYLSKPEFRSLRFSGHFELKLFFLLELMMLLIRKIVALQHRQSKPQHESGGAHGRLCARLPRAPEGGGHGRRAADSELPGVNTQDLRRQGQEGDGAVQRTQGTTVCCSLRRARCPTTMRRSCSCSAGRSWPAARSSRSTWCRSAMTTSTTRTMGRSRRRC